MGPVTFLFVFVWNIIGSIYIYKIMKSSNSSQCLSYGGIIANLIVQIFIYFIYFAVFYYFWVFFQAFRKLKQQQVGVQKNLKLIYKKLLKHKSELADEEIKEMKNDIENLLTNETDSFQKLGMFEEEKEILKLFSVPGFENNENLHNHIQQNIEIALEKKNENESANIEEPNRLTQPLFEMIENTFEDQKIKNKISNIQENANPDEEECIICFSEVEQNSKIVLKCNHKFHDTCIFDWLKNKQTCTMCRTSFRIGLLKSIINYLSQILNERGIIGDNNISTDKLIGNDDNA
jgi:hypothetical protein